MTSKEGILMYVEISTKDKNLAYEIMDKEIKDGVSLSVGEKIEVNGITVTYTGGNIRKVEGLPDIITLTIIFASNVVAGYVGTWLYNKIHGKAESLSIDFRKVDIDVNTGKVNGLF